MTTTAATMNRVHHSHLLTAAAVVTVAVAAAAADQIVRNQIIQPASAGMTYLMTMLKLGLVTKI